MAFEFNKFKTAQKLILGKQELTVECNVELSSEEDKILAVNAHSSILSQEVTNGVVNFMGEIDLKVVTNDAEGQINVISSSCPFSSKFENDKITASDSVCLLTEVLDEEIENVSGGNAQINVMISCCGFAVQNSEMDIVSGGDEDVCFISEEEKVIGFLGKAEDEFSVTSEIVSRDKVKKLLFCESGVVVKNVESGVNFVTISGDVISRILYLTENDKFENGYVYETFKQEIELEGVTREDFVEGYAFVQRKNITATILDGEKGNIISITTPVKASVLAYREESISCIKDCYSIKSELNKTIKSYAVTKFLKSQNLEGRAEGILTLSEDSPRVDKILFYDGGSVAITNSYVKDGEINVDGIAKVDCVYLNDETSLLQSVMIDIPFSISEKTDFDENSNVLAQAVIDDVDVSVKKGRELFVDGKVKLSLSAICDEERAVISNITEAEEYPEKDFSMQVVFGQKDASLWEIAKENKVKEEQILSQNPNLIFPLLEDSPIVLFYQKK